jgi:hypothetical protein
VAAAIVLDGSRAKRGQAWTSCLSPFEFFFFLDQLGNAIKIDRERLLFVAQRYAQYEFSGNAEAADRIALIKYYWRKGTRLA